MEEIHGMMVRIPKALHTQLVREAGEQSAKIGTRITVNRLVVSILAAYFVKRGGKRG